MKKLEIVKIATYENGLTAEEAMKRKNILTNAEVDAVLQDDALRKEYADCFPCWTGTRIRYKAGATTAIITEHGKEHNIKLPLKDGWYLPNRFGIPNGKPSTRENPKARYLLRWQDGDYNGLAARGSDYGRGVYADYGPSIRFGVLGVRVSK